MTDTELRIPATAAPTPAARRRQRRRQQRAIGWPMAIAFLAPALALYVVFVLYPIVQSARYSLYDWNGLGPLEDFVGFENFRRAFGDKYFREALRHNVIIIVLSLALQIPAALALATLLNSRIKGRATLRLLFFAPYVLSEVVTGVVWRQILRPNGMLDQTLDTFGAGGLSREWLADPDIVLYSMFFVITWKYFGFHMIIMLAGLQQIPDALREAAAVDGATPWLTFRHITLPLLGPTIRVSVFLSVIGALQLFDLVWVTTRGGPINKSSTMATFLYERFGDRLLGYASAVSIVIFALSLLVAIPYQRMTMRRDLAGSIT
jgi:raffinose/stachyose/melibiose transport system permease protein